MSWCDLLPMPIRPRRTTHTISWTLCARASPLAARSSGRSSLALQAASACMPCPAGSACSTGSTEHVPCAPGTFTSNGSATTCTDCDAGTYQNEAGRSSCKQCTSGNYCPPGASAQLPCLAGSYSNSPNLDEASDCTPCPAGRPRAALGRRIGSLAALGARRPSQPARKREYRAWVRAAP